MNHALVPLCIITLLTNTISTYLILSLDFCDWEKEVDLMVGEVGEVVSSYLSSYLFESLHDQHQALPQFVIDMWESLRLRLDYAILHPFVYGLVPVCMVLCQCVWSCVSVYTLVCNLPCYCVSKFHYSISLHLVIRLILLPRWLTWFCQGSLLKV